MKKSLPVRLSLISLKDILFLSLLLGLCPLAIAGSSEKKIVAARTPVPPIIDGFLNDQAWSLASPTSSFTQFDPLEGATPSESTSVRILYDDHALYVGVLLYDSEGHRIVKRLTRRDRRIEADRFTIMIDSHHDHQTAFVFTVNAAGVQTDGVLSSDGVIYDTNWDAVWEAETRVFRNGWSAEFKIPFSAIRFPPKQKYEWGINFGRYISRKKETVEWVMIPRRETGLVSKMGHLVGIENIDPPAYIEALPYVLSRQLYKPTTAIEGKKEEFEPGLGLDLRYGLSSTTTLNATFNPDFGQVEADQAVLNLTTFETFYPEKRPFFLEGVQIFDFGRAYDAMGIRAFYSRRIGLQPTYRPAAGERLVSLPKNTTILGAAKVTTHLASGLTLGALGAVTDEEYARVQTSTGEIVRRLAAPLSNFSVFRLKQDILENSTVGTMLTMVNRRGQLPAQTGGLDWSLRLVNNTYGVDGYLMFSHTSLNGKDRVTGTAGRLYAGKIAGEHWYYATTYDFTSRNFNINDIGYFRRPNDHGGYVEIFYKEMAARGIFLRYWLKIGGAYRWNFDNISTTKNFEIRPIFEFKNFWWFSVSFQKNFRSYDDRETRGRGLYRRPSEIVLKSFLYTDPRPKVVTRYEATFISTEKGGKSFEINADLTFRPAPWAELQANLLFGTSMREEAWVNPYGNLIENVTVFGDRQTKQYSATIGGTITFRKNLSIQLYGQLFLAKGHYAAFRRLTSPSTFKDFDAEFRAHLSARRLSPDFNQQVFNANVVLRWEYLPGSTLYLVWTQARSGFDQDFYTPFGKNVTNSFKLPAENVILLKLNYWWSL